MTERILEGRTALVTGSTSGIGLGIALLYAQAGAKVMLNGLGRPEDIAQARKQVGAAMGAEGQAADVVGGLTARIERVRQAVAGAAAPRVLALE